ncbi:MAG: hypothetical protein EZS28_000501 [Streblomastix strix]|uniref:Uncharacterized protein n=1 Tax=Streblomastix strix TaxID=222440 RepID=A0A5J4XBS2_9EUKA|nr:MAG: hypothetical protein EZS28_000501 [Streblomastix strix]
MISSEDKDVRDKTSQIIFNIITAVTKELKEGELHPYIHQLEKDGTIAKLKLHFKTEEDIYIHEYIAQILANLFKAHALPPDIKKEVIFELETSQDLDDIALLAENPYNHDIIFTKELEKKMFSDFQYPYQLDQYLQLALLFLKLGSDTIRKRITISHKEQIEILTKDKCLNEMIEDYQYWDEEDRDKIMSKAQLIFPMIKKVEEQIEQDGEFEEINAKQTFKTCRINKIFGTTKLQAAIFGSHNLWCVCYLYATCLERRWISHKRIDGVAMITWMAKRKKQSQNQVPNSLGGDDVDDLYIPDELLQSSDSDQEQINNHETSEHKEKSIVENLPFAESENTKAKKRREKMKIKRRERVAKELAQKLDFVVSAENVATQSKYISDEINEAKSKTKQTQISIPSFSIFITPLSLQPIDQLQQQTIQSLLHQQPQISRIVFRPLELLPQILTSFDAQWARRVNVDVIHSYDTSMNRKKKDKGKQKQKKKEVQEYQEQEDNQQLWTGQGTSAFKLIDKKKRKRSEEDNKDEDEDDDMQTNEQSIQHYTNEVIIDILIITSSSSRAWEMAEVLKKYVKQETNTDNPRMNQKLDQQINNKKDNSNQQQGKGQKRRRLNNEEEEQNQRIKPSQQRKDINLITKQTEEGTYENEYDIAMLYSKHQKFDDQVRMMKEKRWFRAAVGTPNRILKLLEENNNDDELDEVKNKLINVQGTRLLVIDMFHDQKNFCIFTLNDTRNDIRSIVADHFLSTLIDGQTKVLLF